MKFILGRKIEMSQRFSEKGEVVPVTLVQAGPCTVTEVKTDARDGYQAVQLGFGIGHKLRKPQLRSVGTFGTFRWLKEFRVSDGAPFETGKTIDATAFAVGDKIQVIGMSKGHGFQGVVKRHGFHGSPASHGHKDQLRMPGSIGSKRQGPVEKGKRMAGRMGAERVTVKNLEVIEVDAEKHILAVKGAIPGARGALVLIQSIE